MIEDKKEQENLEEITRRGLRKQLGKTLALYRDPSKTPPKLKESIEELYAEREAKIKSDKINLQIELARQNKEYAVLLLRSQEIRRKTEKPRNPKFKIAELPMKRKIALDED